MKQFLHNEIYAYRIAKLAIVFQSLITICVSGLLIGIILRIDTPHMLLQWLLSLDIIFIALHLSYRVSYEGPKITLRMNEKRVLALHIASALMALTLTLFLLRKDMHTEMVYLSFALLTWILSLVCGVLFFLKKYHAARTS
jgi:hypothetical protein